MKKTRHHVLICTLGILISTLVFTNVEMSAQTSERLINGDFEIGIPTVDKSPSFLLSVNPLMPKAHCNFLFFRNK